MLTEKDIEAVYARNVDSVYRLCYSFMKNKAEAEDMVQETFLKWIDHSVVFASPAHERGWLIVTASNLCKNALRHWWRRREPLEDHLELATEPQLETSETMQAILSLPTDYKTAVYLYYYEGYTTPEIAALLNIAPATARSRLFRARKQLKDILEREDNDAERTIRGL